MQEGKKMKCPNCGKRTEINLDIHSDGFTSHENPVKECGACGLVWRHQSIKGKPQIDIIKPARRE